MNKKNDSPKRSFVPQTIGDSLKKINRNFSSKYGRIEFIIQSKWSEIAGKYFAEFSNPERISRLPNNENEFGEIIYKNYLHVNVAPAAAIEFQHYKDTIIEKINSYFGYKAIRDIKIKQNYVSNNNSNVTSRNISGKLNDSDNIKINDKVKKLKNNDLKKSLIKLGIKITKDSL